MEPKSKNNRICCESPIFFIFHYYYFFFETINSRDLFFQQHFLPLIVALKGSSNGKLEFKNCLKALSYLRLQKWSKVSK